MYSIDETMPADRPPPSVLTFVDPLEDLINREGGNKLEWPFINAYLKPQIHMSRCNLFNQIDWDIKLCIRVYTKLHLHRVAIM